MEAKYETRLEQLAARIQALQARLDLLEAHAEEA
jgi:prefoldin subunit 5